MPRRAYEPEWPGRVKGRPWTLDHFRRWSSQLVYEDEEQHDLQPWQCDIVKDLFAGYEEVWAVLPQGNSKALALDTPLATPSGWTTMGDVSVGDYVLGTDGVPTRVQATSTPLLNRPCYEVVFSDGSSVICDADHLWTVEDRNASDGPIGARLRPARRTYRTDYLAGREQEHGASRFRIPTSARYGEDVSLPVDPYVLGAWLGDGSSAGGRVCNVDQEVWDRIRSAGYGLSHRHGKAGKAEARTVYGLQKQLRVLGILGAKRIPESYMLASFEQRRALLQGIIDTDGSVSIAGQVTIGQKREELTADFRRLAWSLGRPCHYSVQHMKVNGEDYPVYLLTIACDARHGLAHLSRKRARMKTVSYTTEHRRITSIKCVATRPVRCISVEAEDALYLAGEAMIATHNTTLISGVGLYHLDNTRSPWIPVGASSRDQAEILFGQAKGFVERSRTCEHLGMPLTEDFRCDLCGAPTWRWSRQGNESAPFVLGGTRQISHFYNGGRGMKVYAADQDTADGVIPTMSLVDEGQAQKDLALYRTWRGKGRKRRGQILMISTAGQPGSDFEGTRDELRDSATEIKRREPAYGRYATETTVMHEYAIPNSSFARDIKVVKAANPLSTITEDDLRRALSSPTLDFGEDWLRKTCNLPARSSKAAVNDLDWLRARPKEEGERVIPKGVPVSVGADFAWLLDTTALVPLWVKDVTFRLLGPARILVPPRDGNMLDVEEVKDAFRAIHERNPIQLVVMDMSKAEDTAQWIIAEIGCEVVDRTQGNADACEDYEAFMKGLRRGTSEHPNPDGGWLYHSGDKGLTAHVMNAIAAKRPGDKYRFDRENPSRAKAKQDRRVIDALTAAAMVNSVVDAGMSYREPIPLIAMGR